MFNVEKCPTAHNWYILFMFISLHRTVPFWEDIGLSIHPSTDLQIIARNFVQKFERIEEHICREGKVSNEGQQLFSETYQQLASKLGESTAKAICDWGAATIEEDGYYPLVMAWWENLLVPLAMEQEDRVVIASLPFASEKSDAIKSKIRSRIRELSQLLNSIEEAERQPRSESEDYIYQLYNRDDTRTPPYEVKIEMSPLDRLYSEAEYVKAKSVWKFIIEILSKEELGFFLNWGQEQAKLLGLSSEKLRIPFSDFPLQ